MDSALFLLLLAVLVAQAAQLYYLRTIHRGLSELLDEEEEEEAGDLGGPTPDLLDEALENMEAPVMPFLGDPNDEEDMDVV